MSSKVASSGAGRFDTESYRREQELCQDAMASSEFDEMSDNDWVALCEQIASRERNGHKKDKPED